MSLPEPDRIYIRSFAIANCEAAPPRTGIEFNNSPVFGSKTRIFLSVPATYNLFPARTGLKCQYFPVDLFGFL